MTQRVQKAIDIFLDALNEGTLDIGSCASCAVGSLLRASLLEKYPEKYLQNREEVQLIALDSKLPVNNIVWARMFCTVSNNVPHYQRTSYSLINENAYKIQKKFAGVYADSMRAQILPIMDFSEEELMQIEWAFETANSSEADPPNSVKEARIKALAAVVKVMLTFDEDTTTDVKEVFTSKAELISA